MRVENSSREQVEEAVDFISTRLDGREPELAIILGSGLGGIADAIENPVFIDYAEVPGMAVSTVQGHRGRFLVGTLHGTCVICMQGRLHAYEGYTAAEIAFPVYVMHMLGAHSLVVTNAAGGIDPSFGVGDLMLITDQVNMLGMDPCIGAARPDLHARFFDMTNAYDLEYRDLVRKIAADLDISLHEGVYGAELGPSFETPAEIRAFRTLGIDAIGMSTVLEVIAARSCGVRVLGISLISNPAAGVFDTPIEIEDVERAAAAAAHRLEALVSEFVARI